MKIVANELDLFGRLTRLWCIITSFDWCIRIVSIIIWYVIHYLYVVRANLTGPGCCCGRFVYCLQD